MSKAFLLKQFQKEVGMCQQDYQANLMYWFGASSSKELSPAEIEQALANIKRDFGWEPKAHENERQIKRIKYLWLRLKEANKLENPNAMASFVKKFTHVDSMYKASSLQLSNCIQALQSWCDRENVKYSKGQRRG